MNYQQFLLAKIPRAEMRGFEPLSEPHPSLKPHQRDIAAWMCRGGQRADFMAFGLGKTRVNIQCGIWVCEKEPTKKYIIICPLGVKHEFQKEQGPAMGTEWTYCTNDAEVNAAGQFIITNYERVRDGGIKIDDRFAGAGLDEASVLRSYGSKTYQTFLGLFKAVKYRFVFTATPSPNKHKELIHYAGFLGVMDTGDALTRFFKRDSTQANNLTLYPHMEEQFWLWLSSWAVFMQKPSDLGYLDDGYDLPPLKVHWHCVEVDHKKAWSMMDGWGQRALFLDKSSGLREIAEVKRDTILNRLDKAKEIMAGEPMGKNWLLWHDLEAERYWIEKAFPIREICKTAYGSQPLDLREDIIIGFGNGDYRILATKPSIAGSGCNLQRHCSDAIFLGSTYKFNDFIQAVHRIQRFQQPNPVNIHIIYSESEEPVIAELKRKWAQHDVLVEKMATLLRKYKLSLKPDMQLKRTIGCDRQEVEGKQKLFRVIHNDVILELMPIDMGHNSGTTATDDKSAGQMVPGTPGGKTDLRCRIPGEASGKASRIQPPVVSGEPEEVCRQVIGLAKAKSEEGAGDKSQVYGETSGEDSRQNKSLVSGKSKAGLGAVKGKGARNELRPDNSDISPDAEKSEGQMQDLQSETCEENKDCSGGPLPQDGEGSGDSVLSVQHGLGSISGQSKASAGSGEVSPRVAWEDDCVDCIVTSIPFGTQYEYSSSVNDLGHNPSNEEFFKQLGFLVPNLLRVLKPGRIAAIHVKDRIRFASVTGKGVPTVDRFSDKTADLFEACGFNFLGRISIDTDVVRENNQTYRLGWTEACKDMTKMGCGMNEYVLLFRKPQTDRDRGYADLPVTHEKESYSRGQWQVDAAGLWKSDGNRLPDPELLLNMGLDSIKRLWIEHAHKRGYSYREHVAVSEALDKEGKLPASFMLFPPVSNHPEIWTDICRMRTLNTEQSKRNSEKHVCPLQLDIVERLINRFSNKGEVVLDPFLGIGTVAYQAIHMGRVGWGVELSAEYWRCAVGYCEQAELQQSAPTLFDMEQAGVNAISKAA